MGNQENGNLMNWIILVIKGKEIKRDYLSSGERKDSNIQKTPNGVYAALINGWNTIQYFVKVK